MSKELVDTFLKAGNDWSLLFTATDQERRAVRRADEAPPLNELLEPFDRARHELSIKLRRMKAPLARCISDTGGDPAILFKYLHFVADFGGPDGAVSIWPELKAQLETMLLESPEAHSAPTVPPLKPQKTRKRTEPIRVVRDVLERLGKDAKLDQVVKESHKRRGDVIEALEELRKTGEWTGRQLPARK